MNSDVFKYIYGPVPSRRLGRSLGIDLVPYKTCTYDCVYCQLGKTTNKTLERREYFPTADILDELREKLSAGLSCNYISLAGSGEPTLHAGAGELIAKIKDMTKIPVAVITNGSLLHLPEVRKALLGADLVIPSLDAGDAPLFEYVNRPHPDIPFERMVEGLIAFARQYSGRLWLEVLLVSGVTGLPSEARKIAAWVDKIRPEKVQLGTVNRPALEDFACAVDPGQMETLVGCFAKNVEILENTPASVASGAVQPDVTDHDILNLLARRPCTLEGICAGLGLHPQDAVKRIERLALDKRVETQRNRRKVFYKRSGN